MEDQIVTVKDKKDLVITMKPKTDELEEVTVVAFCQTKEGKCYRIHYNLESIGIKSSFQQPDYGNGRTSVRVIAYQRSGEPGKDNAEFFIRGVTTFGYKKILLILIDNNEVTTTELSRIQPDDIASFYYEGCHSNSPLWVSVV